MADDSLSLLYKIRGDSSGAKQATAEARASIAQLRTAFGSELTQAVNVSNKAFESVSGQVNQLVQRQFPLLGNAVVTVSSGLRNVGEESNRIKAGIDKLTTSIGSIAKESNKTTGAVTSFLNTFVQIEGQAKRDAAAIEFFGAALGTKLLPQLEKAGAELTAVAGESAAAGAGLSALAAPIGIAVIALAALAAGAVVTGKSLFSLAQSSAEVEGKLFDLSQQTGITVETLSALDILSKLTGSSIENLTASLGIFQKKLEEAQDPTSKLAAQFQRLNVDTSDTETALRDTFAALAAMPEGFRQTALALELFGRGGKSLLAILKETNGDLDAAISRLREMGLIISSEDAKAADKFNDELELLNRQITALTREIGRELLPAALELVIALGDLVRASKVFFDAIGPPGQFVLHAFAETIKGLGLAVAVTTGNYRELARAIQEAEDAQDIKPIAGIPEVLPTPLPPPLTDFENAQELIRAVRAEVEEAVRFAESQVDEIERQLKARAVDPLAAVEAIIATEKEKTRAVVEGLQAQREARVKQFDSERDDKQKLADDIQAIDKQIADESAKFQKLEADQRAEFNAQQLEAERAHRKRLLDEFISATASQIAANSRAVQAGTIDALVAADAATGIVEEQFKRRRGFLVEELRLAGADLAERSRIKDELKALDREYTNATKEQADARSEIVRREAQSSVDIQLANIDAVLRLGIISDHTRIASIRALAAARVKTEEQAEREILAIRLDAIDREAEAINAKLTAAKTITDPLARARQEAELNNLLKINAAERKAIQQRGDADIEEGRQEDLENEQRYADELLRIRRRVADIQRDTAQTAIDLMVIHHARRRDIVRAQLELDLKEESARHDQELESLEAQRRENAESNRTQEEKNARTEELNRLAEAEAERHRRALQLIKDKAKQDEKKADPVGRITLDTDTLKDFAKTLEDSIVPLNEILANSFLQVADAIGQTVANWVLLGETGPAVMRKILAQALASIAAEAAVNAVKELALGFAMLFLNPAESAAHFTAAGLWASIAGVAAIAGRGVAGDLFKPQSHGRESSSNSNSPQELSPLTLARNPRSNDQPLVVHLDIRQDRHSMVDVWMDDYTTGGKTREAVLNDGGILP